MGVYVQQFVGHKPPLLSYQVFNGIELKRVRAVKLVPGAGIEPARALLPTGF